MIYGVGAAAAAEEQRQWKKYKSGIVSDVLRRRHQQRILNLGIFAPAGDVLDDFE